MRHSLSVIPPKPIAARLIFLGFLSAFLLVLAVIWLQLQSIAEAREEVSRLTERNALLQSTLRAERTSADDTPSAEAIAALSDRIAWYNARISAGAPPPLDHIAKLEETLGADVRLSAFYYDRLGGYANLSLLSESEQSLLKTLEDLQSSFAPKTVELMRQVSVDGASARMIQYELKVSE